MIYYGEKLIKEGKCVEIVRTARGDLELREKTGKLIRKIAPSEVDRKRTALDDIIKQNDWTPTLMERYKIELSKPTRAEMFIDEVVRATGAKRSAIQQWVIFGKTTNDYAIIKKLEKLFGQSFETLFDKGRNEEVEKKYRRHRRRDKSNNQNNEEHGKE